MRAAILLVAAAIAVGAGFFALKMSENSKQQAVVAGHTQNVATTDVLVAKVPVPVGTVVTNDMVDRQAWPAHLAVDGFINAGSNDANIAGHVARGDFAEREPFTKAKLANPNDPSFLAAALAPNMRAVTIATDAISGIAGYVFPGDRVDVLLTHNIPSEEVSRQTKGVTRVGDKPEFSEVLIPNTRVLAVNVRQAAGKETNAAPSSITLEVDVAQAQNLRLAERVGTLSLSLRPFKSEKDTIDTTSEMKPTRSIELTKATLAIQESGEGIRVVRGAGVKDTQVIQNTQSMPPAGMMPMDNSKR